MDLRIKSEDNIFSLVAPDLIGHPLSLVILGLSSENLFPCLSYSGLMRVSIILKSFFMDPPIKSEDDRKKSVEEKMLYNHIQLGAGG